MAKSDPLCKSPSRSVTGITGNQAFLETPEVLAGIAGKIYMAISMYLDMKFFSF